MVFQKKKLKKRFPGEISCMFARHTRTSTSGYSKIISSQSIHNFSKLAYHFPKMKSMWPSPLLKALVSTLPSAIISGSLYFWSRSASDSKTKRSQTDYEKKHFLTHFVHFFPPNAPRSASFRTWNKEICNILFCYLNFLTICENVVTWFLHPSFPARGPTWTPRLPARAAATQRERGPMMKFDSNLARNNYRNTKPPPRPLPSSRRR